MKNRKKYSSLIEKTIKCVTFENKWMNGWGVPTMWIYTNSCIERDWNRNRYRLPLSMKKKTVITLGLLMMGKNCSVQGGPWQLNFLTLLSVILDHISRFRFLVGILSGCRVHYFTIPIPVPMQWTGI